VYVGRPLYLTRVLVWHQDFPDGYISGAQSTVIRGLVLAWTRNIQIDISQNHSLIITGSQKMQIWSRFSIPVAFDALWFRNRTTHGKSKTSAWSIGDWSVLYKVRLKTSDRRIIALLEEIAVAESSSDIGLLTQKSVVAVSAHEQWQCGQNAGKCHRSPEYLYHIMGNRGRRSKWDCESVEFVQFV